MNKAPTKKTGSLLIAGLLCTPLLVTAESFSAEKIESTTEVRPSNSKIAENSESSQEESFSSNFFEFKGVLGGGYQSALYLGQDLNFLPVLALTIDAEYDGWFIESNSKNRISGVMGRFYMGHHLWESDTKQLDLVWGHYTPAIDKEDEDDEEIAALVNLDTRRDDELLGLRYSSWIEDTYYSAELSYDILNNSHRGYVFEGYFGKVKSVRNWDLTFGVGYTWYSANAANYNLGVESHELTDQLTTYNSGAAFTLDLEFSAQMPISQSWVLEVGIVHSFLSDNIKDSPLVVNDSLSSALLGFSYVF